MGYIAELRAGRFGELITELDNPTLPPPPLPKETPSITATTPPATSTILTTSTIFAT